MQCLLLYAFKICKNCVCFSDFIGLFDFEWFLFFVRCVLHACYIVFVSNRQICVYHHRICRPANNNNIEKIVRQFNNRLVCHKILLLLSYKCVLQMVAISGLFRLFSRCIFFCQKKKNVHELLKALHEFNRFIPPKYTKNIYVFRAHKNCTRLLLFLFRYQL